MASSDYNFKPIDSSIITTKILIEEFKGKEGEGLLKVTNLKWETIKEAFFIQEGSQIKLSDQKITDLKSYFKTFEGAKVEKKLDEIFKKIDSIDLFKLDTHAILFKGALKKLIPEKEEESSKEYYGSIDKQPLIKKSEPQSELKGTAAKRERNYERGKELIEEEDVALEKSELLSSSQQAKGDFPNDVEESEKKLKNKGTKILIRSVGKMNDNTEYAFFVIDRLNKNGKLERSEVRFRVLKNGEEEWSVKEGEGLFSKVKIVDIGELLGKPKTRGSEIY